MGAMLTSMRSLLRGMREGDATIPPSHAEPALIDVLPLGHAEPSVRALPLSTDALRTLALRRIHIVNHGAGTLLRDWEVWTAAPDQVCMVPARVVSPEEWALMSRGLVLEDDVPVLCCGDVLPAPTNRRLRRDIPFIVEGMLPDEVRPGCIIVDVLFRDRTNRPWQYSEHSPGSEGRRRTGSASASQSV